MPSENRFLAEIKDWDLHVFVGQPSERTPVEYRFQGRLLFSRALEVTAEFLAPAKLRGTRLRLWVSILPLDVPLDRDVVSVGQWNESNEDGGVDVTILLPEVAFSDAVTAMSTVWRHVHLWRDDVADGRAQITDFTFDRRLHPHIQAWVSGED